MDTDMEEILAGEKVLSTDVVASSRRTVNKYFIAFVILLITSIGIYFLFPFIHIDAIRATLNKDHHLFYWMLLVGFLAEIVAGSMGMGYGVICTTILLILNVSPPVISASIHSAESFTTAAGTISHFKLGNINKKLTKALAIPAIIGAVIGALLLSYVGERYAKMTKPFIAAYTMYLGIRILRNAFVKKSLNSIRKKRNIPWLVLVGGFIDALVSA